MLQVRPADWSSALWTQRQKVASSILEGIGLLFNNVGDLPDSSNKETVVLYNGCVDAIVPERGCQALSDVFEETPVPLLFGQSV